MIDSHNKPHNEAIFSLGLQRRGEALHPVAAPSSGEKLHPEMMTTRMNDREIVAALPEVLATLHDVVPLDAVRKISDHFGGTRLYIPKTPTEACELAQAIGLDAAQAICRIYGGESIEVPKSDVLRRAIRNRELVRQHRDGKSARDLARQYDLTKRQVSHILRTHARTN